METARDELALMHFLVFELDGQAYGVNVDQVGALTEGNGRGGPWRYGGQDIPVQSLAGWLGLDAPEPPPSRVLVSQRDGALRGFLVDTPRDIVTLPMDEIFALPVLIQRVLGSTPLWGVGRRPDGLLPLVDLSVGSGTGGSFVKISTRITIALLVAALLPLIVVAGGACSPCSGPANWPAT